MDMRLILHGWVSPFRVCYCLWNDVSLFIRNTSKFRMTITILIYHISLFLYIIFHHSYISYFIMQPECSVNYTTMRVDYTVIHSHCCISPSITKHWTLT